MHVDLRLQHADAHEVVRGYVERRLRFALSRFGANVGRVIVRLTAESASWICRLQTEIPRFGSVSAEASDSDIYAAIDRAAGRLARQCLRRYQRERTLRAARLSIRAA